MVEGGCGSSVVWNIFSDISLDDLVLSVCYWYYLQVVLCVVEYYCSAGLDLYLDQLEDL